MKTNKDSLKAAMDRRLSFLDDAPSCRAAVQYRIAREEEPVMKKKWSVGLVCALLILSLSVMAVAAGLILSPRVSATRLADQALEKTYGITDQLQTFFGREEKELTDGALEVTYTGAGTLAAPLGTYTAVVRNGQADAGVVDLESAETYIRNNPGAGLVIAEGMRFRLEDHFRGYRVAAKKGELQLIYFVNAVINEATEYATYDAWVEQAGKRAEELGM